MRSRLIILTVALATAALSWMVISPASSQAQPPPTVCNGSYWGGTFNNLVVPSGDSCTLYNSRVKGTITANPNSELRTCGAEIKGSVNTTQSYVNIDWDTTVGGSVSLNEPGTPMFNLISCTSVGPVDGYAAYICPRLIGGSLDVTNGVNSGQEVEIGDCGPMNIHGSVNIIDNNLFVSMEDAQILGSLRCFDNDPTAEVFDSSVTGPTHGDCSPPT
jgi:hypothetical protein